MFEGLFQPMHLLIVLLICVFVFGPKKIPELGRGLGDAIRGFKEGVQEHTNQPVAVQQSDKTDSASAS